jgi:hypothetical protein
MLLDTKESLISAFEEREIFDQNSCVTTLTLLKREFCKEQIKPQGFKIQNAKEVVSFLQFEVNKFHATHPSAQRIVNKTF